MRAPSLFRLGLSETGRILHRLRTGWRLFGEAVAMPVLERETLYLPNKSGIYAISLTKLRNGKPAILWSTELKVKGPNAASPVYSGGMLFTVSDNGVASCLDATSGQLHWQKQLPGHYYSSPIAAAERIYFSSTAGLTTIVSASPVFERLAVNDLKDEIFATPAPVDGQLFIRTRRNLFCVGEPSVETSKLQR